MSHTQNRIVTQSSLPGHRPVARGKVRDVYAVDQHHLIIVATDRISAFDCVLPDGIPLKGEVLTQMSVFWFEFLHDCVPTHFLTADVAEYPRPFRDFGEQLAGRSMLVRRAEMIPVECVARGYLSGSGWKDYRQTGALCGIALPPGLVESGRLPQPIFTPATKAETGHDENVSAAQVAEAIGGELTERLRELTLDIYARASAYAESRGILLADTKFEFGFIDGELTLGDEVLTPDSSRFWPRDQHRPGGPQPSFDKQFVRDWLEQAQWNKQPPAPALPQDVVARTSEKYVQAYHILTGRTL